MSEAEVATYLEVHRDTVRRWRREGKGPKHLWVGSRPKYRQADVDEWLRQRPEEREREAREER
jgi:excisionase family DNA binding protein